MAKTLQFRRGTTSELSSQAGAVGELFVDTDKDTVVVMDGSTTGGFPLAKESAIPSATSDLTNDSGFITSSALTGYATESYVDTAVAGVSVDLTGYATETYVNAQGFITTSALSGYTTSSQFITGLSTKQDTLVSGTNIKTINGTSVLGSGDITLTTTETDPVFTASAAGGIDSTDISNWDTAYGWGDHSVAGYLTSTSLSGYATESYVGTQIANLVDSAPAALDTLNELAAALGDDANFASTITASLSGKQATLVSGTNIKTINGESLLGSGNVLLSIPSSLTDLGITDGTYGQVLSTNGSGTFFFTTISAGGGASITDDTTTNATYYPTMSSTSSGSFSTAYVTSTKYYFNPSTGTLNSTNFNSLSDVTLKKNICTIENASNIVKRLRGVEFEWIDTGIKSSGIIAQELEVVLPHLVTETEGGTKTVNYSGIIAYLIQANSELLQRIEILERSK